MLDLLHLNANGNLDIQVFGGQALTAQGSSWQTWQKPRGKTMAQILIIGKGGRGGNGAIGANSNAAGGGGGGSGAQAALLLPLWAIPDLLFVSIPDASTGGGVDSWLSIAPDTTANNVLAKAGSGGAGGTASGATAGTAGSGAGTVSAANMPLGWQWVESTVSGQNGIAGGSTSGGTALTLPTSGLLVTGGTGGGGLPAAGTTGKAGGGITGAGVFLGVPTAGGQGPTTPPQNGAHGYQPISGLTYFYGGQGGDSTHGSATGAGLVQASGGNGAIGSGGGGSGGALTGSTAGLPGLGGPGLCIIACW